MSDDVKIRVRSIEARIDEARLRLPFRFGATTLRQCPIVTVRTEIEDAAGRRSFGHAADNLIGPWFDKSPDRDFDEKVDGLIAAGELAFAAYLDRGAAPAAPFDLWWSVYPEIKRRAKAANLPALSGEFGVSLCERATIDAACRATGLSFHAALRGGALGFDPARVHRGLSSFDWKKAIPDRPLDRVMCRHTIGMADALREADMNAEARIDDGFPESLEADIARYGLRWFKIKIGGDREANLDRLRRIGETLSECRAAPFHATLDGNEQVEDLGDLEWLHERLGASDAGRAMREAILYVEQPLARDRALAEDARGAIARLARLWPLIIDESDDDVAAFPRALELGYAGVSAKNCKGVFKSILNQCLIARRAEDGESPPAFLSAEDLTATGVVSLQEDLATIAALGLPHCERNGHHYFRGLDRLSAAEREGALAAHGDLYERRAGTVALRIADGAIALGSIRSPGFGYACSIDFEGRMTLDAWRSGRR